MLEVYSESEAIIFFPKKKRRKIFKPLCQNNFFLEFPINATLLLIQRNLSFLGNLFGNGNPV